MELINQDTDDLNNKNIEINTQTNTSSATNQDADQNPGVVQNFISGFQNFFKPKTTSIDIEKDNKENIQEDDSNRMTIASKEENEVKKEESCKDKLANKIIEKLEVERSIGIFSVLICIGIGLIILSFFLLPIVLVSPKKFSFCFAVGSIFVLISFMFLVGTKNYVNKIMDNKRIFISISFILSIFIGIGYSLGNHSFISLICSGVQLISMIMFILTFIPGGRAGTDCIKKALSSPFTKLFINKAKSDLNDL